MKRISGFLGDLRVLALALLSLSLPGAFAQSAPTKPLTIDAIYQPGGLAGRGPENVEWSPDGSKLSFLQPDEAGKSQLWYMDATNGEKKVLVSAEKLASLVPDSTRVVNERERDRRTRYHVAAYLWAPDSRHLLFDSMGQLWIYDLDTGTAVQFTSASDPSLDPKFSPNGANVAYVRKHNLYVRSANGKDEKQLTRDTGDNFFNGDIDWVYTEELGVRSNYFWSPDSKEIVFMHMDETNVPTYPITDWIPTHPTVDNQKYPKVGDPNPVVKLGVVEADKEKVRWISLTNDADGYIPRFGWLHAGIIWAEVMNRAQDKMDLYFVDAKSGKSRIVLTEKTPDGWVELERVEVRFLNSSARFLWPSWRDGHMHLYLYSYDRQNPLANDAKLDRQLEQGDYEVLGIEGLDEAGGAAFFLANKDDPRERHVFSAQLDGSGGKELTTDEGIHAAQFDDAGKHYVWTYSGPHASPRSQVCAVAGACHPLWDAHDEIGEYGLRAPQYREFKADDGTKLYGRLLLPPDAPATAKLPVIIHIYGGPASQMVMKNVPDAFDEILARKGFAIFAVDNRGTPGRGRNFSTATRHEFGAIELKDQLTALDQLLAQYPQLDKDRVAIWGWSNGGSMTLYAMTHSDRFRAGVAVAPVTSQVNYDSIYTERYMGLLKENKEGYEQSDVTKSAANLHGSLLLVHGTSDDNVHFQNSIQMINALISAGKQFRLMIYPNKTHSIAGRDARVQLFTMIEEHFERDLK